MSFKILEQNGVENEVVDGGALNNFCAGNRDGIIAGVLSECALSAAGNGVAISPGLLIICGVRIKITAAETLYVSSVPLKATRYQIIAQVTLGADGNTSAEFFLQSNASLKRDAIYAQGYGTYQAEIGSFTHNPDGSISDMIRTLDVLYGGGGGSANIEVGNVVTQTLPAGQDAEFDMTARNENGKTIFDVKALIPRGASGTDEEAVHFTPQTLTEAQKTQARANINALSAAEADIQHVAVDCDHDYEITGYTGHEWNVAVPDHCQLTVTKIKGQTGTVSPNLLNTNALGAGTQVGISYSTSDGVLSIGEGILGDSTDLNLWIPCTVLSGETYSFVLNGSVLNSNLKILFAKDKGDYVNRQYLITGSPTNGVYTVTANDNYNYLQFVISRGIAVEKSTFALMLVSGTYTADTMPPYQPFNNALTNSKVQYVLSTGKNLLDLPATYSATSNGVTLTLNNGVFTLSGTATSTTRFNIPLNTPIDTNYPVPLTLSRSIGWSGNCSIRDNSDAYLFGMGYNTTSNTITAPLSANGVTLRIDLASGQTVNLTFTVMLNYGSTAEDYTPYIADNTFIVNREITEFGEIDNISKQFTDYGSEIITYDGSDDEGWAPDTISTESSKRYKAASISLANTDGKYPDATINAYGYNQNLKSGMYSSTSNGFNIENNFFSIRTNEFLTIADFKAWLAANPIQIVYKMATPRIQETVNIPAGYSAHKGGLQQQVIEGDYLPYIITKDYPVSGAAQILKNLEIDRDQGKMLDAIQQGALPVGKLANAITIISGDTKKTYDGSTAVEITVSSEQGPEGPPGEQGVPGEAATITIRNVDVGTALPGQPATVVIKNVGTSKNAILDFGFMIPQGEQGKQGERGEQGVPGNSSLMSVVIINPVIGGSSYYGRILLTCPVPSTGIPNNGFSNLIPALKFQEYQVSGIISLDQNASNAKRVYGLRKMAYNGNKLYALIDSQTISAVEAGEELTGASAVVFAQL